MGYKSVVLWSNLQKDSCKFTKGQTYITQHSQIDMVYALQ